MSQTSYSKVQRWAASLLTLGYLSTSLSCGALLSTPLWLGATAPAHAASLPELGSLHIGLILPSSNSMDADPVHGAELGTSGQRSTVSKDAATKNQIQTNLGLTTLLKQVDPNYSTVSLEELVNFNGNLLVFPFNESTTPAEFNRILAARAYKIPTLLVPTSHALTPTMEGFLHQMGFMVTSSFVTTRPVSLTLSAGSHTSQNNTQDACRLPMGSWIHRIEDSEPVEALATLNHVLPLVVSNQQQALFFAFDPSTGCQSADLAALIKTWQGRHSALAHDTSQQQPALPPENSPQMQQVQAALAALAQDKTHASTLQTEQTTSQGLSFPNASGTRINSGFMAESSSQSLARRYYSNQPNQSRYGLNQQAPAQLPTNLPIKPLPKYSSPGAAKPPAAPFKSTPSSMDTQTTAKSPFYKELDDATLGQPAFQRGTFGTSKPAPATPQPSTSPATGSTPVATPPSVPYNKQAEAPSRPIDSDREPVDGDEDESIYTFEGDEQAPEGFKPKWNADNRIAMAEFYNQRMREYYKLMDTVALLASKYPNNSEKAKQIEKAIDLSRENKSMFEVAWFDQRYTQALVSLENAKLTLMGVLFDKIPSSHVEGRAIWLDRGSIVAAGSPENLRALIRRIAESGFNVIFFETLNAGYPIYPSRITPQNPQITAWDPLQVAVDEAHRNNVELHAWMWMFAVGNTRHNKLLGQPDSFPGPILSSRPDLMADALRDPGGGLILPGQHEYWLSPASRKARQFLLSMMTEVVQGYDVDGLQLDYIRYPFQKRGHYVGFEGVGRTRYQAETAMPLDGMPGSTGFQSWQGWKAYQVSSFVKEVSDTLKGMKPGLKLTAAVFPMKRPARMTMIQQDWETWVSRGWIDALCPMSYSNSPRSLVKLVDYVSEISQDKVLVYPGLSLLKLNSVELLDKMEMVRDKGLLGTSLFAYAHFGPDTQYLVQSGPYRERNVIPPHREPLLASRQLTKESLGLVNSLIQTGNTDLNYPALYSLQQRLASIDESLTKLASGNLSGSDKNYYHNLAQSESMVVLRSAEDWANNTAENTVEDYQAEFLKDQVTKMVRMVNYALYR